MTAARWANQPAHDLLPTGDPEPIHDALKAERIAEQFRLKLADDLEAKADGYGWLRRGRVMARVRELRGYGVTL